MTLYDVPAPAKINLFLHVTGRRADGYHLLETVFRFVDLCDVLTFDVRSDGQIQREGETLPDLAPENDLVIRAARLLQQATGTRAGAHIHYRKSIPAGGGLGGGSSDAATTLIVLNRLWGCGLSRADLMRLGLSLGADVPVFIFGESAFASGVGEQLTALPLPDRSYFIAQPTESVPTAAIFSSPHLTRNSESVIMSVFADWQRENSPKNGLFDTGMFGRNDLEAVAKAGFPSVQYVLHYMHSLGVTARMSGSGSCCFVEFSEADQAVLYKQKFFGKITGCTKDFYQMFKQAWVCKGLHEHPLKNWLI